MKTFRNTLVTLMVLVAISGAVSAQTTLGTNAGTPGAEPAVSQPTTTGSNAGNPQPEVRSTDSSNAIPSNTSNAASPELGSNAGTPESSQVPVWKTREGVEEEVKQLPAMRAEISQLQAQITEATSRRDYKQAFALRSKSRGLSARVAFLEQYNIATPSGQAYLFDLLDKKGYVKVEDLERILAGYRASGVNVTVNNNGATPAVNAGSTAPQSGNGGSMWMTIAWIVGGLIALAIAAAAFRAYMNRPSAFDEAADFQADVEGNNDGVRRSRKGETRGSVMSFRVRRNGVTVRGRVYRHERGPAQP